MMRAVLTAAVLALTLCQTNVGVSDSTGGRIYSADPADPWNRIFAALFTRTVRTTMTDEHPDAGPFLDRPVMGLGHPIRVSERTFERFEEGDRAIEALYPSFITSQGVNAALAEPRRSNLLRALDEALAEHRVRTPLARALMQSDLWSAFDALSAVERNVHAARVFIRPAHRPADAAAFLRDLTRQSSQPAVSAAALIMQTLLIDRDLRVRPTRMFSDVQVRTFARDAGNVVTRTTAEEFELSRRMLLAEPASSGFVRFDDASPAYLPIAGNDYGFATPDRDNRGEIAPVLGTLRLRCSACHGINGGHLVTFSLIFPERVPRPVRLPQPNDTRASYVAAEKEKRPEFAHLLSLARSSGAR